jgi:hypothetical protein
MPRGYSARTVGAISVWVRQGGNFFVAPLKHHRERLHLLSDHRSGGLTANERIGATESVPEVVISWACLRMSTAARGSGSPFSTRSQSASCSGDRGISINPAPRASFSEIIPYYGAGQRHHSAHDLVELNDATDRTLPQSRRSFDRACSLSPTNSRLSRV